MFAHRVAFSGVLALLLASPATAQSPGTEAPHRILVYGDSNSWGSHSASGNVEDGVGRYSDRERFAGVMAERLGEGFTVVVDGVGGRTTDLDQTGLEGSALRPEDFNGLAKLPLAIAREMQLDFVVIMLGTNDLLAAYDRSAEEIAEAASGLAEFAATNTGFFTPYPAPRVLLVAPPPVGELGPGFDEMFAGAGQKSTRFAEAFASVGAERGLAVFDAGTAMGTSDGEDGIHFSLEDHRQLGEALAEQVRALVEHK